MTRKEPSGRGLLRAGNQEALRAGCLEHIAAPLLQPRGALPGQLSTLARNSLHTGCEDRRHLGPPAGPSQVALCCVSAGRSVPSRPSMEGCLFHAATSCMGLDPVLPLLVARY